MIKQFYWFTHNNELELSLCETASEFSTTSGIFYSQSISISWARNIAHKRRIKRSQSWRKALGHDRFAQRDPHTLTFLGGRRLKNSNAQAPQRFLRNVTMNPLGETPYEKSSC